MADRRYEYKFVRLEGKEKDDYQELIQDWTAKGWRLVQILAPGSGGLWASPNYLEVIFERRLE